jgi:hypothetical protein
VYVCVREGREVLAVEAPSSTNTAGGGEWAYSVAYERQDRNMRGDEHTHTHTHTHTVTHV